MGEPRLNYARVEIRIDTTKGHRAETLKIEEDESAEEFADRVRNAILENMP